MRRVSPTPLQHMKCYRHYAQHGHSTIYMTPAFMILVSRPAFQAEGAIQKIVMLICQPTHLIIYYSFTRVASHLARSDTPNIT